MIHVFYRSFMESVLQKEVASTEDIMALESVRRRYHIPFSDHLSILSDIEDGVNLYARYLEEYGVLQVTYQMIHNK